MKYTIGKEQRRDKKRQRGGKYDDLHCTKRVSFIHLWNSMKFCRVSVVYLVYEISRLGNSIRVKLTQLGSTSALVHSTHLYDEQGFAVDVRTRRIHRKDIDVHFQKIYSTSYHVCCW